MTNGTLTPQRLGAGFALFAALGIAACSSSGGGDSAGAANGANAPESTPNLDGTTPGPIDPATGLPVPGPAGPDGNPPGQTPAVGSDGPNGPGSQGPGVTPIDPGSTVAPVQVTTRAGNVLDCSTLQRPPTPLRRLTRFEYNNTVRDLFGTTTTPADAFPPDEEVTDGFSNNALVLTVSSLHVEKYVEAAEALAAEATSNLSTLVQCDTAAAGEEACARQFAERFGRRAYRRPLEQGDIDTLMEAYAVGTNFQSGIEIMVRTILQSPHFMYRVEFTGTEGAGAGMVRLNGFETATRLSYLLWGSAPDDSLLDAAQNGELDSPEQVGSKAQQMLDDPRAQAAVAEFVRQWLGLTQTKLETLTKNPAAFPLWADGMHSVMREETDAFVKHVIWDGDASLNALLTESAGLPKGPLAELYGVPASDTVVSLPAEQSRAGVLTLPSFLALAAHPDQTSPVRRGKFVRAKMLCDPPPPPPPEANVNPPSPEEGGTARERFTRHLNEESCRGCHLLMDPLGFTFESFDAMGVFRTDDEGRELDLTGQILGSDDADGPFTGVKELATKLAASNQVRDCVATQWFRYSIGRTDEAGDACSLVPLQQDFETTGANLREMLVAMTQTEAFLYRRAVTLEEVSQ